MQIFPTFGFGFILEGTLYTDSVSLEMSYILMLWSFICVALKSQIAKLCIFYSEGFEVEIINFDYQKNIVTTRIEGIEVSIPAVSKEKVRNCAFSMFWKIFLRS